MERFAKVFDIEEEGTQLLALWRGHDEDSDRFCVDFSCYINGFLCTITAGYEDPEQAEEVFKAFERNHAAGAIAAIRVSAAERGISLV